MQGVGRGSAGQTASSVVRALHRNTFHDTDRGGQHERRSQQPRRADRKLAEPLKRELELNGQPYTLTVSGEGFTLAPKGKRKGLHMQGVDLVSGDAALAVALQASVASKSRAD